MTGHLTVWRCTRIKDFTVHVLLWQKSPLSRGTNFKALLLRVLKNQIEMLLTMSIGFARLKVIVQLKMKSLSSFIHPHFFKLEWHLCLLNKRRKSVQIFWFYAVSMNENQIFQALFHGRSKNIVYNNMRVNKWQNFHFHLNYPLKKNLHETRAVCQASLNDFSEV